jgi:hypothetical protein
MSTQPSIPLHSPRVGRLKGRIRLSKSEGLALVRDWEQSGLPPGEFCAKRGVKPSRLQYWLRHRESREASPEGDERKVVLIPFKVPEEPSPASVAHIEIGGPGGLAIRVPLSTDRSQLLEILRVLQEVMK